MMLIMVLLTVTIGIDLSRSKSSEKMLPAAIQYLTSFIYNSFQKSNYSLFKILVWSEKFF